MNTQNPHIAQRSYNSGSLTPWKTDCLGELVLSLASRSATWSRTPTKLNFSNRLTAGNAVQHLQYMPFGEQFVIQTTTAWETPYKFTGKERDEATGYDYFGARYYDSDLSVWLSVDPLADKYPSMSPYMYTAGNPVMLVDPDGRDWIKDKDGNYKHDKNVSKKTKLYDGDTYLGKSKEIKVNDKDGNYSYSYNLNIDGSVTDTRGNSYDAGHGEIDPKFKSGHTINNNSHEYASPAMISVANHLRNDLVMGTAGTIPIINPFYKADAVVFGGTGMTVGGELSGGGFFVLSGKDKGKFFSFKEVAGGVSTDVFIGFSSGRVDYTGGSNNFRASLLYGDRNKAWVGFGEGFSAGVSEAWSHVSAGWLITTEVNAGAGASVLPLAGFGGNTVTISR